MLKQFGRIFLFVASMLAFTSVAWAAKGVVTLTIEPAKGDRAGGVRVWIPYPVSTVHQEIREMSVQGNMVGHAVYADPMNGATHLFAEWGKDIKDRRLVLRFQADARERRVAELKDERLPIPMEKQRFLQSSQWIPTDGEVERVARAVVEGREGILEKARAVYDWVVENTTRDPNVRGCGLGVVEVTLAKRSGKCADLSSVYVAMARAVGVPAREVFGLRLGKKAEQDITGGYHCWAEFYLPGTGWVPVDPSDVRKIMLVNRWTLEEVKTQREYYFGAVDDFRIVLRHGGRGVMLSPPQEDAPLNYFMYPYAEVDGRSLDYFDPESFRYSVHFRLIE
ncbi:MAG: transglutaminase domain-containing protein [Alphaproteobacteria bacterium]|nr:transglutaminase domain-containing protein [Alphaproteobacteria bacterium]